MWRSKKVPLRLLADYWIDQHYQCCKPDEPIVLGLVEDIDLQDRGEYQYWIDNEQVFLHIKCPNGLHGSISATLSYVLMKSYEEAGIGLEYINPGGSVTCKLLGGNLTFEKRPDTCIVASPSSREGAQNFPIIVCETAAHHESLHHLLCQAATWLNEQTDVAYCVAIKLYPSAGVCVVYQFERTAEIGSDTRVSPEPDPKEEDSSKVSKEQAEAIAGKKPKIPCSDFNPDVLSSECLEASYKVKVVREFRIEFEDDNLVFELHKLFSRTSIPMSLYKDKVHTVNIDAVIKLARSEMRKFHKQSRPTEDMNDAASSNSA